MQSKDVPVCWDTTRIQMFSFLFGSTARSHTSNKPRLRSSAIRMDGKRTGDGASEREERGEEEEKDEDIKEEGKGEDRENGEEDEEEEKDEDKDEDENEEAEEGHKDVEREERDKQDSAECRSACLVCSHARVRICSLTHAICVHQLCHLFKQTHPHTPSRKNDNKTSNH